MAYRSDLEAALARLDAMGPQRPCVRCAARSKRLHRLGMFVAGAFLYLGAFVLLAFATAAGLVAIAALLLGTVVLFSRAGPPATPFVVGVGFAFLSALGFAAFVYLERMLAFDVGRFG